MMEEVGDSCTPSTATWGHPHRPGGEVTPNNTQEEGHATLHTCRRVTFTAAHLKTHLPPQGEGK